MPTVTIDSERIDDVPLLMHWMLEVHIDRIIDSAIGAPHGNRQGLSYGQLAVVYEDRKATGAASDPCV